MKAVILATGDELVLGQIADTNSAWLSDQLAGRGVMTAYHKTVGDDLQSIGDALREATETADLVIMTGGLGPTKDDLARDALAAVLDAPLELHEPSLKRISAFFEKIKRPMSETNKIQAMCPRGAGMLKNDFGTAPGIAANIGSARVFILPGVPSEMKGMFKRHIDPMLVKHTKRSILTEVISTFGAGESMLAEKLGDLMRRDRNPLVGTTASAGMVKVRIRSDFATVAEAGRKLAATIRSVENRLGNLVVGRAGVSLAQAVGGILTKAHKTVVTAESCTGGLVAKMLTDVPGSSEYFLEGWVTYSNVAKSRELGIPAGLIEDDGAVSERVVRAMAGNAREKAGADYALALSGVAGPGGGTRQKPVGMVWIALAARTAGKSTVTAECFRFPGDREMVRLRAAMTALNMLRLELQ